MVIKMVKPEKCSVKVDGKVKTNNNTIELPEYIVDPGTKTTYLKGKFLGKGGFARVHELTDLTTNKVYAGKIIPKSRITKPHQKEKILREIDLHGGLRHNNVVRFQHFFEDDECVYIILEYCPRKSLVHVLKNRRVLTEPEVRYYMHQLSEGVFYIHSQDVIHRDLKLGNMFLSEEMEMKIGDFGLAARLGGDGEKKITVCGTPNYIAPEVLNMEGHGFETDVWAMGCIMYAMLVGQPPFETATLSETYARITTNSYSIPTGVSTTACDLIKRMLRSQPSERPSLTEILQHEFFTAGYRPQTLPTSCCSSVPKFPAVVATLPRSSTTESSPVCQESKKVTHSMSTLRIHTQGKLEPPKVTLRNETVPRIKETKKETSFHSTLKQKLTSVLCLDKSKKSKPCTTSALYQMVLSCVNNMPEESPTNPPCLMGVQTMFVAKWIDYSNKYGFGFQLSDNSVGVLFNDATRISQSPDKSRIEFHEVSGKWSAHSTSNIPSHLLEKYTLLKYFAQYMDENLTEGGDMAEELVKLRKGHIPCMKRWVRTSQSIIMQLDNGTLQINFFKDHTKIVLGTDGHVTYINEERRASSYSLDSLLRHGCDRNIGTRMQYALSVLNEFVELEGDDA